jgi:hypothetical protein
VTVTQVVHTQVAVVVVLAEPVQPQMLLKQGPAELDYHTQLQELLLLTQAAAVVQHVEAALNQLHPGVAQVTVLEQEYLE